MMARIQQQLGSTDDEWSAIQPKVQKVMQDQRDAGMGGMMGMRMFGRNRGGGNGGGGGGGGNFGGGQGADQTPSAAQQALTDLNTTLQDPNASADVIKTKLDALRDARGKAKEQLAADQKDLQSVLTQRQEAYLVMDGLLD